MASSETEAVSTLLAVTTHSSQGATAYRVLVHVDTEQAHDQLVNSRLAYVSVSRGRYDAQIYTNDAHKLGEQLSRDVSKQSAMETGHQTDGQDQGHVTANADHQSVSESHDHGQGYAMEHSPLVWDRFLARAPDSAVLNQHC